MERHEVSAHQWLAVILQELYFERTFSTASRPGKARIGYVSGTAGCRCAFIDPDPTGPILVMRLDDAGVTTGIGPSMKAHGEGAELAVLQGEKRNLSISGCFVVLFKGHLDVFRWLATESVDSVQLLRQVSSTD